MSGDMQMAEQPAPPASLSAQQGLLRIAVGIATVGRPAILRETLARLSRQTRPANAIIVSTPTAEDVAGLAGVDALFGSALDEAFTLSVHL